jgi:acyl carrier protein
MILQKICELISEQFAISADSITADTVFVDDLGADSLDVVELTMALEEEFGLPEVPEEDLKAIVTVGDLADYVSRFVQE